MKQIDMRRRGLRGVSLIELMISMVIGLVIALAATSAYLGASNASKVAEVQGRMNEDAQMALTILSQQLRMAGNNPARPNRLATIPNNLHNPLQNPYGIRGCDTNFTDITVASASLLACSHSASSAGPDAISIGYEADRYNTVPTSTGGATDCMGSSLSASTPVVTAADSTTSTVSVYEAENRFYVGTSTTVINPTLYCKGNNTAAQPLVENVEDLQLLYGVSNPSVTPTAVLGYLTAYGVENDTTTLNGLSSSQRWNAVKTVRICLVMRSAEPAAPDSSSAKYVSCAGNLTDAPDLLLRRAFTSTVVLRNY
jgi:type IV pilus assembly protein PilW